MLLFLYFVLQYGYNKIDFKLEERMEQYYNAMKEYFKALDSEDYLKAGELFIYMSKLLDQQRRVA